MTSPQILQFGTSRFLQAHVDLFISEALGETNKRPITVVQTSGHAGRAERLRALAAPDGFPVHIRGFEQGNEVWRDVQVTSVGATFALPNDLERVTLLFAEADIIISNTSEAGWVPQPADNSPHFDMAMSFPAKLTHLLRARHASGGRKLQVMPTELVPQNGQVLRDLVLSLAAPVSQDLSDWIASDVIFVDSLVDRIVSTPLEPAGAVAEPYALWAIADGPGVEVPWDHPAIVVTSELETYETLKLFILNLSHTYLIACWKQGAFEGVEFVRDVMENASAVETLQVTFDAEVLPGFAAAGLEAKARAYFATTLDRFRNPFLDHRLSDIAQNHEEKCQRRLVGFMEWARALGADHPMPRLERAAVDQSAKRNLK